ncbi:MAG: HD domain-containing protein [Chloroflexota bacterium]|nr:HD domain-containing protein [Chloroflexota bacterium]
MREDENTLSQATDFIAYVDQLKGVIRQNGLFDDSRSENTAEHSWHAALSAIVLSPYANEPVDIDRVTRMLLIHDLIEIEAGDTFVYDGEGLAAQETAELKAAEIVFGRLPQPLGRELRTLWDEFEARQTADAKFAKAVDRFMPLFSNIRNGGSSWLPHGITKAQVIEICHIIQDGSETLWALSEDMLDDAEARGWLRTDQ